MMKLTFYAEGYITQTVEILNPDYTPERLISDLNSGELFTSLHEPRMVVFAETFEPVARIIALDNELEYSRFELPPEL